MITFVDEILADIDWRISELTTLKSIPIRYGFRPDHKDIHIKYSIPAIYAVWEGYVKNCFIIYSNHLNTLAIKRNEISNALLTHRIDSECSFDNPRQSFETKKKLVAMIDSLFTTIITIKPNVPTESNVNYKVLNQILDRFCITNIDSKYEKGLNKLLFYRNTIAHGENSISVNMTHVSEFISLVENLMLDIVINIQSCENIGTFKK